LRRQLGAEDQIEEFDTVFQCQKTPVVRVRLVGFPRNAKVLIGPSPTAIMLLIITGSKGALGVQVVHQIVYVEGRLVAARALALAKKDLLSTYG
jgi:hypothetical protein